MLAVIVCSLFNAAMLVGLLTGLVAGSIRARAAIGDALRFEPLAPVIPRGAASTATWWQPA